MVPRNDAYISQAWDTIFLYDVGYTIKDTALAAREIWYPSYYLQILLSKQYDGYQLKRLWVDGESYAIQMTKTNNPSAVEAKEA
jgi:hypothetical protein